MERWREEESDGADGAGARQIRVETWLQELTTTMMIVNDEDRPANINRIFTRPTTCKLLMGISMVLRLVC